MRRVVRATAAIVGTVVGVIVIEQLIETALMTWAIRTRSPRAMRLVTSYHKHLTNPVMVRFFSGRSAHACLVEHVGRRSGATYVTPVTADRSEDTIIVPLPYGAKVDWVRNLRAAGGGVVTLDGRSFAVDEPEVLPLDLVRSRLSPFVARIVRLHDTEVALRLHVVDPTEQPSA